jgi:hypothetical protein
MEISRKTGRIEVILEGGKWAMLIFQEGVLWHVEPRGFRGASPEDIVFELIKTPEANFVFQRLQLLPSLERTIQTSIQTLIMEGTKRIDDEAVIAQETGGGAVSHVVKFKPGAEAKVRYVPQNVKKVLVAIDGKRTLGDVIQQCGLDANQAGQIIKELIKQEVIETIDEEAPAQAPTP